MQKLQSFDQLLLSSLAMFSFTCYFVELKFCACHRSGILVFFIGMFLSQLIQHMYYDKACILILWMINGQRNPKNYSRNFLCIYSLCLLSTVINLLVVKNNSMIILYMQAIIALKFE